MGIFNFLLRLIGRIFDVDITQNEQGIRSFLAKSHYSVSLAIVAIISTAAIYLIIIQVIKFVKAIQENKISKLKILFGITLSSVIIASFIVHGIKEVSAEKPLFIDDNDIIIKSNRNEKLIFIGETPHFRWKFDDNKEIEKRLKSEGKNLRYKVEYSYLKTGDIDYNIEHTNQAFFDSLPPGDMQWKVIPGFCKNNNIDKCKTNNNFIPLSKFNNSSLLETSYYPNLYEKIKDQQVFRVLTTGWANRGYFSFRKDGRIQGFDYSLAEAIKNELFKNDPNVKIDMVYEPWEKLFPMMQDGKTADIAINTISRRKDREDEYAIKFSEPYLEDITLSLIVSKKPQSDLSLENNSGKVLDILEGKSVGVLKNSTADKTLREFNNLLTSEDRDRIEIVPSNTSQDAIYDLNKHKTNFVLVDTPYVEGIKYNPLYKVESFMKLIPESYPDGFPQEMIGEDYCVVVNSGHINIFLDELNQTIKRLKDKQVAEIEASSKKLYKKTFEAGKKCLSNSETKSKDNSFCNGSSS